MIQMESLVQVADNTGARSAKMIGVIGKRTRQAHIGDIITCHIRESIPTASVKKGTVVKAVVVFSVMLLQSPEFRAQVWALARRPSLPGGAA